MLYRWWEEVQSNTKKDNREKVPVTDEEIGSLINTIKNRIEKSKKEQTNYEYINDAKFQKSVENY